jgi:acyl dehydratase
MRGDGGAEGRLYFEDFRPGRVFELGTRTLSEAEIMAFAREWDPQDMHLDPAAATAGLIASGWQTVCVWMRLYVDAVLARTWMLPAPGVDDLRWLRPVRPGMSLHGRATVLESWLSNGAPGRGSIRLQGELFADDGEPVMTMRARGHARLRQEVTP